jgi:MEMO1 family protein
MVQGVCPKLLNCGGLTPTVVLLCILCCSQVQISAQEARISIEPREFHYSYFCNNPDEIMSIIKNYAYSPCKEPGSPAFAGIVPHHFLAKELILEFYNVVFQNGAEYDSIFVLGPDHYNHSIHPITLTDLPWKTAFGIAVTDPTAVNNLKTITGADLDPEAFAGEHSISLQMDFIHYYFPNAKVIPVLLCSRTPLTLIEKLSSAIHAWMKNHRSLLLVSADFAHNCTVTQAEQYDAISRDIILHNKIGLIPQMHIDCKSCLTTLLLLAQHYPSSSIEILNHSNSALISQNPALFNVTSYLSVKWGSTIRR